MQEIGNIIISYREAQASLNNFDKLMKKEVEEKPQTPKQFGAIEKLAFENVSFTQKIMLLCCC